MPIAVNYPGVYIEELPSSVRTVVGVATSTTAFVGRALKGPENQPVLIHSYGDYERIFGGLWKPSNMSYAVYLYFLNGGKEAIIVRLHRNAVKSSFTKEGLTPESPPGGAGLTGGIKAANSGTWAEDTKLQVIIENDPAVLPAELAPADNKLFNVTVQMIPKSGSEPATVLENHYNVSLAKDHPRRADKVLGAESQLVTITVDNWEGIDYNQIKGSYLPSGGSNGDALTADEITGRLPEGNPTGKQGIFALEDADIFNLLCIPPFTPDEESGAASVYTEAEKFCEKRRAIFLVDPPNAWKRPADAKIESPVGRDKNAAVFYPRIKIQDPIEQNRVKTFVPSPVIAGVIARIDSERGIWKSPAGIDAAMAGIIDLDYNLTDGENGALNPKGINCLRNKAVPQDLSSGEPERSEEMTCSLINGNTWL